MLHLALPISERGVAAMTPGVHVHRNQYIKVNATVCIKVCTPPDGIKIAKAAAILLPHKMQACSIIIIMVTNALLARLGLARKALEGHAAATNYINQFLQENNFPDLDQLT